ncbi:MAG: type 4a pilus biogenesis protein PilO [Planctomycetes bacterium]|nr:type 4a pilus biogenesis protein PilO [Planctomycetota bacterium]
MGIGAAVLLTAGALFLTFRSYQKAEEGKRAIANVRQKISEAREKRRKIPALEKDVIILRSNVEEYVKILPEDKHIHNFINTINRFEQESGITMTKLDAPGKRSTGAKSSVAFDRIVYKLKIAGSLKSMLGFINKFENYERFVAIEDFQFRPERQTEDDQKEVLLAGSLELETYVYNGAGGDTKPVEIRDIEQKREALREQIIAQRNAVEIHRYRLDPVLVEARRDLFRDPRQTLAAATKGGLPTAERLEKQKRFVAWTKAELQEIQEMIAAEDGEPLIIRQMELKKQIDERVGNLNGQLVAARNERQITAAPLLQEIERDVIAPLERIIKERRIAVRTGLLAEDLQIILGKMEHFFQKGDLAQVVSQFDMVASQIGSADTEDAEVRRLVQEIYALKNQAMVITEFSLRPIRIHGIIAQKGGPVAIINGRVFEQGQMLDGEVKIHDIRPEEIEFVYREVRIVRRWE